MRLLTYNIFWKFFYGDNYKPKCIKNAENICQKNIREIILTIGLESGETYPDYDFMSFQELELDKFAMLKLPFIFLNNYKYETVSHGNNSLITFYKKKYNLIKKRQGFYNENGIYRPYMILVFKEEIIHVNLTLPHDYSLEKLENIFMDLRQIPEYHNPSYNVILSGDFNFLPDVNFLNHFIKFRSFYNVPFFFTCCKEDEYQYYDMQPDNIFTTIGLPLIYKTIENPQKYIVNNFSYMSDHLPVYCKTKNN